MRPHLSAVLRLLAALLLAPVACGTLLAILDPAAARWARDAVPLPVDPTAPSLNEFVGLAIHNTTFAAGPMLGAALLSALHRRPSRAVVLALLDVYLLISCTITAVVLAIAAASYRPLHLLQWMPHLPVELSGLAVSLAVYIAARRRALRLAELAVAAPLVAGLMVLAAIAETCSQPGA